MIRRSISPNSPNVCRMLLRRADLVQTLYAGHGDEDVSVLVIG